MEKQWTTVSETVRKAQQDARESLTPSKEDVRKNRRIALALASTGVFLILIGAAPFLFGDNNSSEYAAFLGQDPKVAINAVPAEGDTVGVPSDGLSEGLIDFGASPIPFEVPSASISPSPALSPEVSPGATVEPTPVDTGMPGIPGLPVGPPEGYSPAPTDTTIPVATEPPVAEITPVPTEIPTPIPTPEITLAPTETPLPTEAPTPTQAPAPTEEVITETVEFPINVHVGGSEAPKDFNQLEMGGDPEHAAAPNQPASGAPLLPLLAFSGAGAAIWRRLKGNKSQK